MAGNRTTTSAKQQSVQRRSPSKSLLRVYGGAPTAVQRQIVEQALIPVLDSIPRKDAKRVIGTARKIIKRADQFPLVDMTAKKTEINGLLDELTKDLKLSSRSRVSKYELLLVEVVESLAEWLNDLWSMTVEFGIDLPRVHSCLLFSMGVLDHIQGMKPSGCRCLFSTIYTPITIRDGSGKVVKEFNDLGISNVESAILWVWRDVFLALLASKTQNFVVLVPELLAEIDDVIGWNGLERLVLGGTNYRQRKVEQFKGHEEELTHSNSRRDAEIWYTKSDPDDEEIFYAVHWSYKFVNQVPRFRRLVQQRMIEIYKAAPSATLHFSIVHLSPDGSASDELLHILSWLAPTSASSLASALEIYAMENKPDEIASLLETHAFLLRPQDRLALQDAAHTLAASVKPAHRDFALRIAEKELMDTVHAFLHALQGSFSRIDTPEQTAELRNILRMSRHDRAERVENWVDAASTPGMGAGNPMAVAAMMMGIPIPIPIPIPPPGDAEDAGNVAGAVAAAAAAFGDAEGMDHIGMMDLDPHDPDFTNLREEYKPTFRERLDGWLQSVKFMPGLATGAVCYTQGDEDVRAWWMARSKAARIAWTEGEERLSEPSPPLVLKFAVRERRKSEAVLVNVTKNLWRLMPWVFGPDIVDEMVAKLADKPGTLNICDALELLSSFCETQKKKDRRRRLEEGSMLPLSPERISELSGQGTLPANAFANGNGNTGEEEVGTGSGTGGGDGENLGLDPPAMQHDDINDLFFETGHFNGVTDDSDDSEDSDDDFENMFGIVFGLEPNADIPIPNPHAPGDNPQLDMVDIDPEEPLPPLEPVPTLEPVVIREVETIGMGTGMGTETGSGSGVSGHESEATTEPVLGGPPPALHFTLSDHGYGTIDDLD